MSDTTTPAEPHESELHADTNARALAINLSKAVYGTFAEIGAGQEVARWFLRVGAASGTVAKSISAYDKTVSDQIYGAGTRYVSRERLLGMLDHEFTSLRKRLEAVRGATTTFFAFADTVAARNFKGDNEQHGWVGIRFQATPMGEPNDILLHVNLMDPTAEQQQESLGILGVNLIFAAFRHRESSEALLAAIFTGLTLRAFEVDVVEVRGPALAGLSTEQCSLDALCRGMSHAVVFDAAGHVTEPSSVLRKKPLIVERGRFQVVQPYNQAMLEAARKYVQSEGPAPTPTTAAAAATTTAATPPPPATAKPEPLAIVETTVLDADGTRHTQSNDILERVRRIGFLGPVVVSDFPRNYLLVDYLRRFTTEPIRFVFGVSALARIFDQRYYQDIPGGLLEGLGKLLAKNVRILVFPMPRAEFIAAVGPMSGDLEPLPADKPLITAGDIHLKPPMNLLRQYIWAAGWLAELPSVI